MKTIALLVRCLAWFAALLAPCAIAATPQGTAFTYQGQLDASGALVSGTYTMTFKLFDAASGGNQVGLIQQPVTVVGGLFSTDLDYGQVFTGSQYWLDITVNGQTLSPRQPVNVAPVAQYALAAPNGVTSYTVNPVNAQWLWNDDYPFHTSASSYTEYFTRYYDIAVPALTQDILDNGTVQVFFTPYLNDLNQWTPLPFRFLDGSSKFYYVFAFTTTPGHVRLQFFFEPIQAGATTPTLSTYVVPAYKFKVVLTSARGG